MCTYRRISVDERENMAGCEQVLMLQQTIAFVGAALSKMVWFEKLPSPQANVSSAKIDLSLGSRLFEKTRAA